MFHQQQLAEARDSHDQAADGQYSTDDEAHAGGIFVLAHLEDSLSDVEQRCTTLGHHPNRPSGVGNL
jgi:hypothetical protein